MCEIHDRNTPSLLKSNNFSACIYKNFPNLKVDLLRGVRMDEMDNICMKENVVNLTNFAKSERRPHLFVCRKITKAWVDIHIEKNQSGIQL